RRPQSRFCQRRPGWHAQIDRETAPTSNKKRSQTLRVVSVMIDGNRTHSVPFSPVAMALSFMSAGIRARTTASAFIALFLLLLDFCLLLECSYKAIILSLFGCLPLAATPSWRSLH